MLHFNNYGYRMTPLTVLLWPVSLLFRWIVFIRRLLFRCHIKKVTHFSVPVVVVGNITMGGTGKTPLVIYLAHFLKQHGFVPGIVSRGVGGVQEEEPVWVGSESDPAIVGDEALLLAIHSDCPVVICRNRVAAVQALLSSTHCTVILSDDGLQHYHLGRTIEIAVIDGVREFGNGFLLPAGPLREPISRLKTVDIIVQNGGALKPHRSSMRLTIEECALIQRSHKRASLDVFRGQRVHVVAGIGNPSRFFESLRDKGIVVIEHAFPDHYVYTAADFVFSDDSPILMTEKDAVKCRAFADARFWYAPAVVSVDKKVTDILIEGLLRGKEVG